MAVRHSPEQRLEFPCNYEFKAFGSAADEQFAETVRESVSRVVPISRDALRTRLSSGGRYQCVTALVRLESGTQLTAIYHALRAIEGLHYLL